MRPVGAESGTGNSLTRPERHVAARTLVGVVAGEHCADQLHRLLGVEAAALAERTFRLTSRLPVTLERWSFSSLGGSARRGLPDLGTSGSRHLGALSGSDEEMQGSVREPFRLLGLPDATAIR